MISILEIYMNQVGFYVKDARHAEKKALNFLIIFAILMNRHKLAKMLWKRTEDPVPVALACAMMYKNLLPYCQENYIRAQIEKNQTDFAECAVGLLDASFKENDPRSYTVLQEKYSDWNNCTALELAYNSKNRNFIAHPCCQKMLTKRLFGHIQIREFNKDFLMDLPSWVKVIMSAFFFFPMYFWIIFPIEEKSISSNNETADEEDEENEKDAEKEEEEVTKKELNQKLIKENKKPAKRFQRIKSQSINDKENVEANSEEGEEFKQYKERNVKKSHFYTQPIHMKIYYLWTAPYTKFWINFISYICFLMLFGVVTLWPGNIKNFFFAHLFIKFKKFTFL